VVEGSFIMPAEVLAEQRNEYQGSTHFSFTGSSSTSYHSCIIHAPATFYETGLARRWWSLSPDTTLPLFDGTNAQLVFAGRPGSSAGPDVHDAILALPVSWAQSADHGALLSPQVGDVEFHIHTRDWYAHQHHLDARYNSVLLHVVMFVDPLYSEHPTMREDGTVVPLCVLSDFPSGASRLLDLSSSWPCHSIMRELTAQRRAHIFELAGLLRFEQKTDSFVEQLHHDQNLNDIDAGSGHDIYDSCLLLALAEGLAYGRDRAFFRAVGLRLQRKTVSLPEPLGRELEPSPIDDVRLRVLARMHRSWRVPGPWHTLQALLLYSLNQSSQSYEETLARLRSAFVDLGLSLARTDILICNVVLPFAAAIGLIEHQQQLVEWARLLYQHHPGLPSNRVTRMMQAQLQLEREPRGSCQQQGLHYIYQQTCREKRCDQCFCGRNEL
jgi:hypothetical protein